MVEDLTRMYITENNYSFKFGFILVFMKYEDRITFDLGRVRESELETCRQDSFHFVRRAIQSCYPSVKGVEALGVEPYSGEDAKGNNHQTVVFSYSKGFVLVDHLYRPAHSFAGNTQVMYEHFLSINSQATHISARNNVYMVIEKKIKGRFPNSRRV